MAQGRTIMIVGNGPQPEGAASRIDAADQVIRFNACGSYGRGGRRTDIVAVCNTGRPAIAMLGGGRWKNSAPVRAAREIWCVRDGAHFAGLRASIVAAYPDLDDLCDDYTAGFRTFAQMTGRRLHQVSASRHTAVDADLAAFSPSPYVVPSSGLIVIAEVFARAAPADRIILSGFTHQGWPLHPFAAERRHVETLAAAGRLSRLVPEFSMPVFEGA